MAGSETTGVQRSVKIVTVAAPLLESNDRVARANQQRLNDAGVLAINIIAGPGAGKTSLIVRTIEALRGRARIGVIEGDIAGSIDTTKVLAAGASDAVQINTGGNCHLEARMVRSALDDLNLQQVDILLVENVGNLVCPTHWQLGEHLKLCLLSTAEGHDKPIKYPDIFAAADLIVLNKIDLVELVDFERAPFYETVRALNAHAPILEVSCRNGQGLAAFAALLTEHLARVRPAAGNPQA